MAQARHELAAEVAAYGRAAAGMGRREAEALYGAQLRAAIEHWQHVAPSACRSSRGTPAQPPLPPPPPPPQQQLLQQQPPTPTPTPPHAPSASAASAPSAVSSPARPRQNLGELDHEATATAHAKQVTELKLARSLLGATPGGRGAGGELRVEPSLAGASSAASAAGGAGAASMASASESARSSSGGGGPRSLLARAACIGGVPSRSGATSPVHLASRSSATSPWGSDSVRRAEERRAAEERRGVAEKREAEERRGAEERRRSPVACAA